MMRKLLCVLFVLLSAACGGGGDGGKTSSRLDFIVLCQGGPVEGALVSLNGIDQMTNLDGWVMYNLALPQPGAVQVQVIVSQNHPCMDYLYTDVPNYEIDHIAGGTPGAYHILLDVRPPDPPPDPVVRRKGKIALDGRVFKDDGGQFLSIGASFMAAVWAFQHDRERLIENLKFLKEGGIDFVRILGVVGPSGGWYDRMADPREPEYAATIAGITELVYQVGMRVQWTIFGGIDTVPTHADRQRVVTSFVNMSVGREHMIQYWEVSNESHGGPATDQQVYAAMLAKTGIPTAISDRPLEAYNGSAANLLTVHVDRSSQGDGGLWRWVRQYWEVNFLQSVPRASTSNEPKGPKSSIEEDADPLRIAMAAAVTWIAGGASFTLHTGPGVRFGGEEDIKRGRERNFWEVENIMEILPTLQFVRSLLPADVPNWSKANSNQNFPNYPFDTEVLGEDIAAGRVLRAYCALRAVEYYCAPIALKGTSQWKVREAAVLRVTPIVISEVETHPLKAGERIVLDSAKHGEAVILKGVKK